MVRGEIYFADLAPRSGSEQRGRRPCVVVSHDAFTANPRWQSVTVVPFTSSPRWFHPAPTVVLFRAGECGLGKDCAALAHQVTTLDRGKLVGGAMGRLAPDQEEALAQALRNYLGL